MAKRQTSISKAVEFPASVTGKEVILTTIGLNVHYSYIERTHISEGVYIDSEQKSDGLNWHGNFESAEQFENFLANSPQIVACAIDLAQEKAAQPLVDLANAITAKQNSEITSDEGKI